MAAKISNWLGTRSHRSHLSGALAAEALSLLMARSHTIYLREVFAKTLGVKLAVIPIKSFVDSNNL